MTIDMYKALVDLWRLLYYVHPLQDNTVQLATTASLLTSNHPNTLRRLYVTPEAV
jgi:hypothetical protein